MNVGKSKLILIMQVFSSAVIFTSSLNRISNGKADDYLFYTFGVTYLFSLFGPSFISWARKFFIVKE